MISCICGIGGRRAVIRIATLYPFNETNTALDDLKHSRFNGQAVLKVSGV